LILLFLVTVINYLDRQSLSVLAPVIKKDLAINDEIYSQIVMAFMVANAGVQLGFGPLLDRIGTRLGFAIAVTIWSVGGMLHALASGAFSLGVFRFILGAGEGGNWPAASKAVAEWFPAKERGLAMGFFNGGTAIGAILAPPMAALLATKFGWRAAFLVTSASGLIWLVFWMRYYHVPQHHPRILPEELELIQAEGAPSRNAPSNSAKLTLLGNKDFWGIFLARFITTPVWWFVTYWLPIYLGDRYGLSLLQIGLFAWIPFLAADIGNIMGGHLSGVLVRRGRPAARARIVLLGGSSLVMLASIPAAYAKSAGVSIALISTVTLGFGSWAANILALSADVFRREDVGTVVSWSGTGAVLGGIAFTYFTGKVADVSFIPVFIAAGAMPIIGCIFLSVLNREPREA
jgi:ACS family hexuronate transporter-like MFS transporter